MFEFRKRMHFIFACLLPKNSSVIDMKLVCQQNIKRSYGLEHSLLVHLKTG